MRQLGGYELQQNLGGRGAALVWQGRDGDGRPALVFLLPAAYLPQARTDLGSLHPALLPLDRSGVAEVPGEGGQPGGRAAYLGSRLPSEAQPLDTLDRAGVLTLLDALTALHRAGAVHGGLCPAALWRTPAGETRLAGAGVPWAAGAETQPTPAQDLHGLGDALEGVREAPDLPADWLAALRSASGPQPAQVLLERWQPVPAPAEERGKATGPRPAAAAAPAEMTTAPAPARQTPDPAAPAARARRLPLWPWALALLVAAATVLGSVRTTQFLRPPDAPQNEPDCCAVSYTVHGADLPVHLQVLDTPPQLKMPPAQAESTAPGTMQLPGPGEYRVRVWADGYTPQTIAISVPRSEPVVINLE
ncbi:hypothetical protein [Deinococcus sp. Marseille-Q6407]|uniref:hypothetical protein n=1 Tax=Deinococcus sp. Marseille-Q6407 TaxID=2969223 RepID=UPI0021C0FB98|nr:hypothetical protein [Deinococcus sp. Marseille-Q6407]